MTDDRIVTIGLAPAWDICCRGEALDWNTHVDLEDQTIRPAGKALNISTALAWMNRPSIAAGLWGRDDFEAMKAAIRPLGGLVQVRMTRVAGPTRRNITVIDTHRGREMHLRSRSSLATEASLGRLAADLKKIVHSGDICVFSGAMPAGALLEPVVGLSEVCRSLGARVAVDSRGDVLERLVAAGLPWLIAPNVEELCELLGRTVQNTPARLATAARGLLEKVPMILISRGNKGAMLITERRAWTARARTRGSVVSTVGCGDFLLAGFLAALADGAAAHKALATAVKVATARASGWTDTTAWSAANRGMVIIVASL